MCQQRIVSTCISKKRNCLFDPQEFVLRKSVETQQRHGNFEGRKQSEALYYHKPLLRKLQNSTKMRPFINLVVSLNLFFKYIFKPCSFDFQTLQLCWFWRQPTGEPEAEQYNRYLLASMAFGHNSNLKMFSIEWQQGCSFHRRHHQGRCHASAVVACSFDSNDPNVVPIGALDDQSDDGSIAGLF